MTPPNRTERDSVCSSNGALHRDEHGRRLPVGWGDSVSQGGESLGQQAGHTVGVASEADGPEPSAQECQLLEGVGQVGVEDLESGEEQPTEQRPRHRVDAGDVDEQEEYQALDVPEVD